MCLLLTVFNCLKILQPVMCNQLTTTGARRMKYSTGHPGCRTDSCTVSKPCLAYRVLLPGDVASTQLHLPCLSATLVACNVSKMSCLNPVHSTCCTLNSLSSKTTNLYHTEQKGWRCTTVLFAIECMCSLKQCRASMTQCVHVCQSADCILKIFHGSKTLQVCMPSRRCYT